MFRWTAPHPEWRTRIEWGHEVASYALVCTGGLSLVDPLLPAPDSPAGRDVQARLDDVVAAAPCLDILVTIPYHTRSSEALFWRYRDRLPVALWGHPAVAKQVTDPSTPLRPDRGGRTGGELRTPARDRRPAPFRDAAVLPGARALAFGDALVCVEGDLRIWQERPLSPAWYHDKFLPSLLPLLELDVEIVLATHGAPLLRDGRAALRRALASPPWDVR